MFEDHGQIMGHVKILIILFFLVSLATAAEARNVQMAVATFSQSVLPLVVAQEKGYFREEDLDVELILMTASMGNMALLGGNVDFNSSGSSVIGAISRGAPLKFALQVGTTMFRFRLFFTWFLYILIAPRDKG